MDCRTGTRRANRELAARQPMTIERQRIFPVSGLRFQKWFCSVCPSRQRLCGQSEKIKCSGYTVFIGEKKPTKTATAFVAAEGIPPQTKLFCVLKRYQQTFGIQVIRCHADQLPTIGGMGGNKILQLLSAVRFKLA